MLNVSSKLQRNAHFSFFSFTFVNTFWARKMPGDNLNHHRKFGCHWTDRFVEIREQTNKHKQNTPH